MNKSVKDLLESRITTKWWLDKDISDTDLNYILECARLAPSRHGVFATSIFVSKDHTYKKWLYENNTYCYGISKEGQVDNFKRSIEHPKKYNPDHKRYNGQVIAPVVLTWIYTGSENPLFNDKNYAEIAKNDALISASYASIAALEKQIDFGFCSCIGGKEISEFLQIGYCAIIVMGLGYKDEYLGNCKKDVVKNNNIVGWDMDNIPKRIQNISGRKYRPDMKDYVIWD
jgi:nitroreductase